MKESFRIQIIAAAPLSSQELMQTSRLLGGLLPEAILDKGFRSLVRVQAEQQVSLHAHLLAKTFKERLACFNS